MIFKTIAVSALATTVQSQKIFSWGDPSGNSEEPNQLFGSFYYLFRELSDWGVMTDIPIMAKTQGLELVQYDVETEDGWLLTLHRLVDLDANSKSGQTVVMAPQSIGASNDYLVNGRKSPAKLFAQEGNDVWLANYRGSFYSSNSQFTEQTWDF